ncbi:alpha/beta hydrolase [Pseudonocardia ailaonensis]|uniref:Alpha/beta hydrolase n=1 Tax=Pseudonocardia ailaonensis TaxID=367279 RepID=A0ABN2MWZ5_9PSEU
MRTSDGVYLAVVEFGGEGPPILLLHGLMGRATTWWSIARALRPYGRVLGLDARGHGRSQAAGPWTTDRMARDAEEVLARVGPGVVVGHSMGGLHALALAARRPDLVRAVVVEDMGVDLTGLPGDPVGAATAWFGAMPQPFASREAVRQAFGHPRIEFGDYMAECVDERADGLHLLTRVRDASAIAAGWVREARWADVDAIGCPALLIEAEESVVPEGQMAEMARRIPHARHVRLPGTGHLVHADEEAYLAVVEPFLKSPREWR